jgi:hypothetical protein
MMNEREAFEHWRKNVFKQKYVFNEDGAGFKDHNQCIEFEAWQAALASISQEPVAWRWTNEPNGETVYSDIADVRPSNAQPLYTGPQAQQATIIEALQINAKHWEDTCHAQWENNQELILKYEATIAQQAEHIAKLEAALTKLRDCDFVISLPDRMDAVRDITRKALE